MRLSASFLAKRLSGKLSYSHRLFDTAASLALISNILKGLRSAYSILPYKLSFACFNKDIGAELRIRYICQLVF